MVSYEFKSSVRCFSLATAIVAVRSQVRTALRCIVCYFLILHSSGSAQDLLTEKILSWSFQKAEDVNSDLKPDGWQRLLDRSHPQYIDLTIQLRDESSGLAAKRAQMTMARFHRAWTSGRWNPRYIPEVMPPAISDFMDKYVLNKCLHVEMDGGAAERVSPTFPIDARFAYSLSSEIRTQNLHGHQAWVELHLLDEDLNTVEVLSTLRASGDSRWKRYDTEVASVPASQLKWGRIHVKVEPQQSLHYVGSASFDTIEVFRLPRLSLTTQLAQHIATPGEPFDVVCTAMGLRYDNTSVKFTLHDCLGKRLKTASVPLQQLMFAPSETPTREELESAGPSKSVLVQKTTRVYDGAAAWSLTLNEPGLYRVRVDLGANNTESRRREILLAVMPSEEGLNAGPFSWSIPEFNSVLQPEDLPRLVRRFGASRVKIPIWFDENDASMIARLTKLIDRLQSVGATCVGRFDTPPANFGLDEPDQVISLALLRNPDSWEPMIAPVLTRLGMKITWFQLGRDDDLSLMSHPDVAVLLQDIRQRMQTYTQDLKLSLNWTWLTPEPTNPAMTWNAVQNREATQLTAAELDAYLVDEPPAHETWISFDPLSNKKYSLLDRVRDLTERAIVIKKSGVKAAFLSDPFDPQRGLFSPDGSVGEMLLPWHTLVSTLGTASYVGNIQMPGGSDNHIFQSGEVGLMLVWNDTPTQENLYLGESVTAVDIWGRAVEIRSQESAISHATEQILNVDAWPLIVRGVDVQVVRWRQQFQLPRTHLASTLGISQIVPLVIENTFPQTANVSMNLYSPSLLGNKRANSRFELGTQGKHERPLSITVRSDASAGKHQLRFNFDVTADRRYQFSVYRSIALGLGDVEFNWHTVEGSSDQQIELRLELLNHTTSDVSFDCKIFPAGQAYQRLQVMNASPGATQKQIVVKRPTTADGGIWIRCEQIGTGRILNYRIKL